MRKDETFIQRLLSKKFKKKKIENIKSDVNSQELNRKKGFMSVLGSFIENKTWLDNTDVHCWWCCHNFNEIPVGLPYKYDIKTKKFTVKGVYCSFACMNAFKQDNNIPNKDYLIKYLYKKLTGENAYGKKMDMAPPRCSLKIFGGDLSIDEFRNSSKEDKIYNMVEFPMFVSRDYIEEIDVSNMKAMNNQIFNDMLKPNKVAMDNKKVEDARFRLSKIEETTVTVGNTIDKFIKFG